MTDGVMVQLKSRIDKSGPGGIPTKEVREDHDPVGGVMMYILTQSGEYITRRDPDWRIYRKDMAL